MGEALREPPRILPADVAREAQPWSLRELPGIRSAPRPLTLRDLTNETARAAYELGRHRGREQGLREGRAQGLQEGRGTVEAGQARAVAETVSRMQALLVAWQSQLQGLEHELAGQVVALAADLAREVVRRELSMPDAALVPAAREALRVLGVGASGAEVRLHPEDAARIGAQLQADAPAGLRVVEDASLAPGECRVVSDIGVADAGLARRWQAVLGQVGVV